MDKSKVLEVIKKLKADSKKRKFTQSFDLVVTLKGLDMKKADDQVDLFLMLPYSRGKKAKICALSGAETKEEATKVCDKVILDDDFEKYAKDKKAAKVLADEYDYFIAQANMMTKVAAAFGKVLGVRGKMPNPKIGSIFPPKAALRPVYDKLQKTVRIQAKTAPMMQLMVGMETQKDEEVAENIMAAYTNLVSHLKGEINNVKQVLLKLTMSKPVELDK